MYKTNSGTVQREREYSEASVTLPVRVVVNDADDADDAGQHLLCACCRDGRGVISAGLTPLSGVSTPYSRYGHRDRGERCNSLPFGGVLAGRGPRLRAANG
jgi:hypothetical protein